MTAGPRDARQVDRRTLLRGLAGAVASIAGARHLSAQRAKTRLVLLGTGGGPRPKVAFQSAQVVVVLGVPYVIDCGNGVARQLVLAGVPPATLRHIFITHHHSDHNADYGNLLLLSWGGGLKTPVDTWGPPPLARMTSLFFEMNSYDIETRIKDEGRVPLAPLVHVHEITTGGVVMRDDRVTVTAALVQHPPVSPAFAYRIDAPDRSIVVSGDTTRTDAVARLARGADVLVHEAMFVPALDRLVSIVPNASTLKEHLLASHTSAEDCGRIAAEAGVKTLVLSHLVPPDDPAVTDQMWIDAARAHFNGRVVLGKDLLEV